MRSQTSHRIRECVIFAMLGSLMFISKLVMEFLPNVHLLGALTVLYTVVYRKKALIPIYIYVMLNGLFAGFATWWIAYTYIWAILWGMAMLIPRKIPDKVAAVVYPLVCSLHGFVFGILYAPSQALIFGLNFGQMIAWIIAGLPFDIIHGISNLVAGLLILPLSKLLLKLERTYQGQAYTAPRNTKIKKVEENGNESLQNSEN